MSAHISVNGPYKKGSRYVVNFYCGERTPKQKQISLRTSSRSVARQKLRTIEGQIAREEWDPWQDRRPRAGAGPPLGKAISEYLAYCRELRQSEATLTMKRNLLTSFSAHVGEDTPAAQVETEDVREWLGQIQPREGKRPAANTVRSYVSRISGLYTWLVESGRVEKNPAKGIDLPKPTSGKKSKALRPYEVDRLRGRLIEELPEWEHFAPVIDLCAACGFRRGEVVALPLGHVHLTEGEEYVEVAEYTSAGGYHFKPKHGLNRRVELFPRAAAILRRLAGERVEAAHAGKLDRYAPAVTRPGGGRIGYSAVGKRISYAASKALRGRGVTMHWLRHTHATWICNDMSWPLTIAQQQLGHRDIKTTRGYVHSSQGSARAAMQQGLEAVGLSVGTGAGTDAREVGEWLVNTDLPYLG